MIVIKKEFVEKLNNTLNRYFGRQSSKEIYEKHIFTEDQILKP